MSFIQSLEAAFQENSNPENGLKMEKYMRNHFSFFGIKTTDRRLIFKAIWKENQQEVTENARAIAWELFIKPQRELQYCGIEILIKELKKNYKKEDIQLIEKFITTNSWWDSVDVIAKYLLGEYVLEHPLETEKVIEQFSNSDNIWLNRSAIIFQLGYKEKTNFDLLKSECEKHKNSNEFFIQKAIGWALREYTKTNPQAVKNYVNNTNLKNLSQKEALKHIL
ncbi:MAG: DNA alkylation repair protein [Bacteroidota bacterium]